MFGNCYVAIRTHSKLGAIFKLVGTGRYFLHSFTRLFMLLAW